MKRHVESHEIPIPPEVEDDVRRSMRERRQDFLKRIQIKE